MKLSDEDKKLLAAMNECGKAFTDCKLCPYWEDDVSCNIMPYNALMLMNRMMEEIDVEE